MNNFDSEAVYGKSLFYNTRFFYKQRIFFQLSLRVA